MWERLRTLFSRRQPFAVWYDPAYRWPVTYPEAPLALEMRRADDALHYLLEARAVVKEQVFTPQPATYAELLAVHEGAYLESLSDPLTLAGIFATERSDVVADELMRTVRLACGGTVAAARHALKTGTHALNLLGGFHHAGPRRGGGFCAVNDVAVAIQAVRSDGFEGAIAIVDLDAHPPDGTAECVRGDAKVWLGSLSGTAWAALEGVDETVLPKETGDGPYLEALDALLGRMPTPALCFVLAGGDVLAGDRLGGLGLSVGGARRRDLRVLDRIGQCPSVWLPAGGYGEHAWKVLAGTGLALAFRTDAHIPSEYDPLAARFSAVARRLQPQSLGTEPFLTQEDVEESFGPARVAPKKLLDFYTAEGLELALEQYGLLPLVRRLHYGELEVELHALDQTDTARLVGKDLESGARAVLVELAVERKTLGEATVLFVNWLSLKNPRARFSESRPQLPGQERPGLGLAREMTQMLGLMAERLRLDGVAFRPSWFHMAYAARHTARFVDPARQGRFEALVRDLREVPLAAATAAVAEGRVLLDGRPYTWEPDEMVSWLKPPPGTEDPVATATERERCRFTVSERSPPGPRAEPASPSRPTGA